MRVSRLGNSLMVRVPASVVTALDLRAGDEVEVLGIGEKQLYMRRDPDPKERKVEKAPGAKAAPRTSPQSAQLKSKGYKAPRLTWP